MPKKQKTSHIPGVTAPQRSRTRPLQTLACMLRIPVAQHGLTDIRQTARPRGACARSGRLCRTLAALSSGMWEAGQRAHERRRRRCSALDHSHGPGLPFNRSQGGQRLIVCAARRVQDQRQPIRHVRAVRHARLEWVAAIATGNAAGLAAGRSSSDRKTSGRPGAFGEGAFHPCRRGGRECVSRAAECGCDTGATETPAGATLPGKRHPLAARLGDDSRQSAPSDPPFTMAASQSAPQSPILPALTVECPPELRLHGGMFSIAVISWRLREFL